LKQSGKEKQGTKNRQSWAQRRKKGTGKDRGGNRTGEVVQRKGRDGICYTKEALEIMEVKSGGH
jgi:hypothetical protein